MNHTGIITWMATPASARGDQHDPQHSATYSNGQGFSNVYGNEVQ